MHLKLKIVFLLYYKVMNDDIMCIFEKENSLLKKGYILYLTSVNIIFGYIGLFHYLTVFQFRTPITFLFVNGTQERKYQVWVCTFLSRT